MSNPKKNKFLLFVLIVVFLLLNFSASAANKLPKPKYPTSKQEIKKVLIEEAYYYRIMEYTPPVRVKILKDVTESAYTTPEDAMISLFSAMFAKNYEWWLSSWAQFSQSFKTERDKKKNRTPYFWINTWERVLKNKELILTHRAETGEYVIIGYQLRDATNNQIFEESGLAFKYENQKWLATDDLASDPVKWGWRNPEKKLQETKRTVEENPKELFRGFQK